MRSPIGTSFQAAEIVDLYLYRPPYPAKIYELISDMSPNHDCLLDLGCGHGKIARYMARAFKKVTAVDPSAKMISLGKTLEPGASANIYWREAYAEDVHLAEKYDVVVTAQSLHWMDHQVLFPKLSKHLRKDHLFLVIEGDGPHDPPWAADW